MLAAGGDQDRYQPAVRHLVVKHDRIAAAIILAGTAEAAEKRIEGLGSLQQSSSALVENRERGIYGLYILRSAHRPVYVRGGAGQREAGEPLSDTFEAQAVCGRDQRLEGLLHGGVLH